ncbi:site-specific integrase [Olivibacter sp. LS-1]|uniref:site-specific integrase n=1 Tax=Olivibacter sp. LS-1 TaxID=2592345 RepID=UPI0011EB532D|nr:site-specific integrase [Olivibacter sp. LS-1]QEL01087.1 site-specific integrase [Olivibacter sp. LS-1]
MATTTLTPKVFVTNSKGVSEVKFVLYHKRERKRIDTNILVRSSQIKKIRGKKKEYDITDSVIRQKVSELQRKLDEKLLSLSEDLPFLEIDELKSKLEREEKQTDSGPVNIIKFGKTYVQELKNNGRKSSASTIQTVVNNLADFVGCNELYTDELTYEFMIRFESYLRRERSQTRVNHGRFVTTIRKGLDDAGIHTTFRDFRILFYEAERRFNEKSLGIVRIRNNPFEKYKIVNPPERRKVKADVLNVLKIGYSMAIPGSREELAKDMYLLSFYLCGMNGADIYHLDCDFEGRAEYERSKTKGRRKDNAFISINIPDLAWPIIEKWKGKLKKRYCDEKGFNKALNAGMRTLCPGEKPYDARRKFGDLARNTCRFSKDDVALALNHYDRSTSTTDPYISKDWTIIDEVQAGVLCLLSSNLGI